MKKNYSMRAGALLLALTLVTSCFVGGTFAKYTTSGTGDDTARVAKFGVTVTGAGTTFAKEYNADDSTYATGVTVQSTENVVAPGTKGEMAAFTITGTPEVAVKVTYEATEFELGDKWVYKKPTDTSTPSTREADNGEYYCPLTITIGPKGPASTETVAAAGEKPTPTATTSTISGLDYESVEAFETAVKDAIKGYSVVYAPGTDLSTKGSEGLYITWAWPFEATGEGTEDSSDGNSSSNQAVAAEASSESKPTAQDDVKDTYLGDQAASNSAAEIKLTVKATVTQID